MEYYTNGYCFVKSKKSAGKKRDGKKAITEKRKEEKKKKGRADVLSVGCGNHS